jgi:Fe-coproporphyrin III synthase
MPMSTLVTISVGDKPAAAGVADISAHAVHALPVVVIFPHNQCNCRCVMCDIWRIREPQEISFADLERQLDSFRTLGVRWVVFSGGEPQMNSQLATMSRMLRAEGIRVTLLTAGLLLEAHAETIAATIDDVIVSLDGPPAVHNSVRRVTRAFERLASGVSALRQFRPDMVVQARCTVQKANHGYLRATVQCAKDIDLQSVSFLAADVTSTAFNRPQGWLPDQQDRVALNQKELSDLETEVEQLISDYHRDINSGFVVETPEKLRRIVAHFRAHLGRTEHVAPRCNAPWVSAVIEASGDVHPCFFHPALGNIHHQSLPEILNGTEALRFRTNLDIAANPICRRCVCSLHLRRENE